MERRTVPCVVNFIKQHNDMKTAKFITGCLMLLTVLMSCKHNNIDPDREHDQEGTYFNFALNGPRENGVYTIEVTPNSNIIEQNLLVSASTFSKGTFGLGDADTKHSAIISFSRERGLV